MTGTLTHQQIADELAALSKRSWAQRDAIDDKQREACFELQAECAKLGHIYAGALPGRDVRLCCVCGAAERREATQP